MEKFKFDENGLIPAIIQDVKTKKVLMVAYMNKKALQITLKTGKTCFYSRSRNKLWIKGETSGHFQKVKSIATDCDKDTLLIQVTQTGAACHLGYLTCFAHQLNKNGKVVKVTEKMMFDPKKIY